MFFCFGNVRSVKQSACVSVAPQREAGSAPDSLPLIEMNVGLSRLCRNCLLCSPEPLFNNSCQLTSSIFIRVQDTRGIYFFFFLSNLATRKKIFRRKIERSKAPLCRAACGGAPLHSFTHSHQISEVSHSGRPERNPVTWWTIDPPPRPRPG